VWTKVNPELQ